MKQNSVNCDVPLSAKSDFPSCLRMRSHDCFRNTSSSYFSALCNSLLWLRASIHAENTWNNQMCTCSLSFFFSTQAQMHRRAHTRTHSLRATQTRHSCHVILLGIVPTAKHVTYQKSLRQSERAGRTDRQTRQTGRQGERISAHLSVCESSL